MTPRIACTTKCGRKAFPILVQTRETVWKTFLTQLNNTSNKIIYMGSSITIFLDVDGVLNSDPICEDHTSPHRIAGEEDTMQLDRRCVIRFEELIIRIEDELDRDIRIVLSSDWRLYPERLAWLSSRLLNTWDLRIRDTTPNLETAETHTLCRGHEIETWRQNNPKLSQDPWVIFDDADDMLPEHSERFVLTDSKRGLSGLDIDKAFNIIRSQC